MRYSLLLCLNSISDYLNRDAGMKFRLVMNVRRMHPVSLIGVFYPVFFPPAERAGLLLVYYNMRQTRSSSPKIILYIRQRRLELIIR